MSDMVWAYQITHKQMGSILIPAPDSEPVAMSTYLHAQMNKGWMLFCEPDGIEHHFRASEVTYIGITKAIPSDTLSSYDGDSESFGDDEDYGGDVLPLHPALADSESVARHPTRQKKTDGWPAPPDGFDS